MGIFSKKIYIEENAFTAVAIDLSRSLESLREQYIFGVFSALKREGIEVSKISREIIPGSELEDALIGFQLTSVIGIAWNYIRYEREQIAFEILLRSHVGAPYNDEILERQESLYNFYIHNPDLLGCHTGEEEGSRAWRYNVKYSSFLGNIASLSKSLASDVHMAMGSPEPRKDFLVMLQKGAQLLIGLSQLATYRACGDDNMAKKLRQHMTLA